ncbi:fibroblast growth factor 19 [Salarias fasciatus]|uniref:fibroblast growth factor 19 n=1 Tax=Salarias fasciatus TaxID=181472 RepID=UPI0011770459|nr:fibroblast growth factor 19 [Salarias fasciatus]
MRLLLIAVSLANVLFAARGVCMPLSDPGPHITQGWGQVVRLRHLFATRSGLHLLISGDGQIRGSADQSVHSLLEIRPVDLGSVVFIGVATSHFLCMGGDGTLYSSLTYSPDDCTFREHILADGHSVYTSAAHGVLLSLGGLQQGQRGQRGQRGSHRGVPALAQFLPRINTLDQTSSPRPEAPSPPGAAQTDAPPDAMDSYGKLSQIIHSPSFHKR